ncbi:MAG: hypothetical protein KDC86_19985 [Saprospiraceae bacterium]|nr:hypothetical protein [Saprospiraceae bacterium]
MNICSDILLTPIAILLNEVWPENIPLIKDSGLWTAYQDDSQESEPLYCQSANEGFSDFVRKSLQTMINADKEAGKEPTIEIDLAIAFSKWERNEAKL